MTLSHVARLVTCVPEWELWRIWAYFWKFNKKNKFKDSIILVQTILKSTHNEGEGLLRVHGKRIMKTMYEFLNYFEHND